MTDKETLILGIETSCDETAASVVADGHRVLSNVIASSADVHRKFGGVVPELASRQHLDDILPVVDKALTDAGVSLGDLAAIGVTYGPGLIGSLLVGVATAKALAISADKPLVKVHHLAGHIAANYIANPKLKPPFLALVISGAHSHIVKVTDYRNFSILARTRDDAPGEAFDKIARQIGLGYPGGPLIDRIAQQGNSDYLQLPRIKFAGNYDFSFSGLKTATLNHINQLRSKHQDLPLADIAASFQTAVVDTLIDHFREVIVATGCRQIAIAGGVSANSYLRKAARQLADELDLELTIPELCYCTDNAAMIAAQAYYHYLVRDFADSSLNAYACLELGTAPAIDR